METVWKTLNYVTILILCHDFCNEFCVCVCVCIGCKSSCECFASIYGQLGSHCGYN